MPLYGVGYCRTFFIPGFRAGGEKKFSFFFYRWLVFLSTDRLLPTCCPDPAKGEATTFIFTRPRVCEFPMANFADMHHGETLEMIITNR